MSAANEATLSMLRDMQFDEQYIKRAVRLYQKNYGQQYDVTVLAEIIQRLQEKDKKKNAQKPQKGATVSLVANNNNNNNNKPNGNTVSLVASSQPVSQKSQQRQPPPPAAFSSQNNQYNQPRRQQQQQSQQNNSYSNQYSNQSNNNINNQNKQNNNNYGQMQNNMYSRNNGAQNNSNNSEDVPPPAFSFGGMNDNNMQNNNYGHGNYGQYGQQQQQQQQQQSNNNNKNLYGNGNQNKNSNQNSNKQNNNQNRQNQMVSNNVNINNKYSQSQQSKQQQPPAAAFQLPSQPTVNINNINNKANNKNNDTVNIGASSNKNSSRNGQYGANKYQDNNVNVNIQASPQNPRNNKTKILPNKPNMNSFNNPLNKLSSKNQPNQTPQSNNSRPTSKGSNSNTKTKGIVSNPGVDDFVPHLTIYEAEQLRVHDKIDHRDQVGRFVYATIVEKHKSNLKVHYDGWSRKWDTYSDYRKELHRFAKAGSISQRPSHRFKNLSKGDFIDLNPSNRHPGWRAGEIRRLDPKSGQCQVVYEYQDKNFLYWAHIDNRDEIAEFTTKSGTDHDLQKEYMNQINKHARSNTAQNGNKNKQLKANRNNKYSSQVMNVGNGQTKQDELDTFKYIRQKRFPKQQNEKIDNKYTIGDWLEVCDVSTQQWITATVTDKENNWIVVHFDGWPNKYDQKIHVVRHRDRLRELGGGLAPDQMELEIKQEMATFVQGVKALDWNLIEIDADGNCLYRCFATEIYGETKEHLKVREEGCKYMCDNKEFFQNFIVDFDDRMKQKAQQYEWGDHVDITALSELYNVRVRVFELQEETNKLYMSFDQGEHEATVNLPLIMLGRHRKKHYNIIKDPEAMHKRPLGIGDDRSKIVSLRQLRIEEEQSHVKEQKDDEKDDQDDDDDEDDEDNNDNNNNGSNDQVSSISGIGSGGRQRGKSKKKLRKVFDLDFTMEDFQDVMALVNAVAPLEASELATMFDVLQRKLHQRVAKQWGNMHKSIPIKILDNFWESTFNDEMRQYQCLKWVNELQDKVHGNKFDPQVALSTFNSIIARSVAVNLGAIVQTQKRVSNVDEFGVPDMSSGNPNNQMGFRRPI